MLLVAHHPMIWSPACTLALRGDPLVRQTPDIGERFFALVKFPLRALQASTEDETLVFVLVLVRVSSIVGSNGMAERNALLAAPSSIPQMRWWKGSHFR